MQKVLSGGTAQRHPDSRKVLWVLILGIHYAAISKKDSLGFLYDFFSFDGYVDFVANFGVDGFDHVVRQVNDWLLARSAYLTPQLERLEHAAKPVAYGVILFQVGLGVSVTEQHLCF